MRRSRRPPATPPAHEPPPSPSPAGPDPVQVLCGATLCRLHVWSDAEWAALPERRRPAQFARAPGLGWVGALPVATMN